MAQRLQEWIHKALWANICKALKRVSFRRHPRQLIDIQLLLTLRSKALHGLKKCFLAKQTVVRRLSSSCRSLRSPLQTSSGQFIEFEKVSKQMATLLSNFVTGINFSNTLSSNLPSKRQVFIKLLLTSSIF
jgi:hypothetical protein